MEPWKDEELLRRGKEVTDLIKNGKLEDAIKKLQALVKDPRLPESYRSQVLNMLTSTMMNLPDRSELRKNALELKPTTEGAINILLGMAVAVMFFQEEIEGKLELKSWKKTDDKVVGPLELIGFALTTENGADAVKVLYHLRDSLPFIKGAIGDNTYDGLIAMTETALSAVIGKFGISKN